MEKRLLGEIKHDKLAPKHVLFGDVDGMKWREFGASLWLQSSTVRTMGGVWRCHSTTWELNQTCTVLLYYSQVYIMAEPVLFTKVTVYSLLACVAQFAVGFAFAQKWGNKCSAVDRWVLVWLFYDAIVHFTLVSIKVHTRTLSLYLPVNYLLVCFTVQEGPFVYMSLVGNVATSDNLLAELCEYAVLQHSSTKGK